MKRPWSNLPIKERMELLRSYSRAGFSYKEASEDFSNILKSYEEGGKLTYEIYEEQTGKPWNTAREEGLTDGSYEQNIQLRNKLLNLNSTKNHQNFKDYTGLNFNDAFAKAYSEIGEGGIFTWNNKPYLLKYKEEAINHFTKEDENIKYNIDTPNTINNNIDSSVINNINNIDSEDIYTNVKNILKTSPLTKLQQKQFTSNNDNTSNQKPEQKISKTTETNTQKEDVKKNEDKILKLFGTTILDIYNRQDITSKISNNIIKEQIPNIKTAEENSTVKYLKDIYNNALNEVLTTYDASLSTVKDVGKNVIINVEDIFKYGKGWINKVLMEKTNLVEPKDKIVSEDITVKKKKEGQIENIPELFPSVLNNYLTNNNKKQKRQKLQQPQEKTENFTEDFGYEGKNVGFSLKANGDIHTFSNAFVNSKGYNYTPIPNVGNYKDTTYNSPGVAHFLLDSDVSQEQMYKHEFAKNMIDKQLKGENIQPGSTVTEQYFPIGRKLKNGKINIKYKLKKELSEEDMNNIIAPLRQYRYSDFEWSKPGVKTNSFNNSVVSVPVKNTFEYVDDNGNTIKSNESHLIYAKNIGKKAYGDFSGTSVVFIINKNGERLIIDYGNSVDNIQKKAKYLMKKYNISEEEFIIGMHDLGSFNAKPVGKKGKLKYNPKSFNPKPYTGGALAF